jgi:gamma-glutamylcyclotransferase
MGHGRKCERMKLYFAYGSNMWAEQMQCRCPDHCRVGKGTLEGYRWIISSRGYANVVKSASDEVFGVIYEISGVDEELLDRYEGVATGSYRKELLSVEVGDSSRDCLVYIDPIEDEGVPKAEYVERINMGIEDAELPPEYVRDSIRKFVPELVHERS